MSPQDPSRFKGAVGGRGDSEREPIGDRDKLRSLAAELTIAEERERRRIADGLHDRVGQLLGVAKIKLGEALKFEPVEEVAEPLSESRRLIEEAIREIRALTFELSSPVLRELGLEASLADLAERMQKRHGISCRFKGSGSSAALPEELALQLHSIVRELLWNVVKHASARQAVLAIEGDEDRLRIFVEDDGLGFDATRVMSESDGWGLLGVRERLGHLGGTLELDSVPGCGTKIVLTVPLGR